MAARQYSHQKLSLQELETRRRELDQETQNDLLALRLGLIKQSDLIERNLNREFEQRWLEMEALLLNNPTSAQSLL
jgi:hypothetical protein